LEGDYEEIYSGITGSVGLRVDDFIILRYKIIEIDSLKISSMETLASRGDLMWGD
jgi:hypothetical protein